MWLQTVTESKLVLPAVQEANKLNDKLLGQEIATLFVKTEDWENGGLVSQRTIFPVLESRFLLKEEEVRSDISRFQSVSRGDVLIYSLLQSFIGGPSHDVSCELNKSF